MLEDQPRPERPRVFAALARAVVFAVACELPSQRQLPLSRHSAASIQEGAVGEGIMVSVRTVQRILAEDALKPWHYRSWIGPRNPDFRSKAAVILDPYQGIWRGRRLGPNDFVVCADEKPGIQARRHRVEPPGRGGWPGRKRLPALRGTSVPVRLGRATWTSLGPMRAQDRHCSLRPVGGTSHELGTLPIGPSRMLDRGQRLVPSGPEGR
jgi:hypothetical protein